jgi:DNA-binding PadR family transcriptional regulator
MNTPFTPHDGPFEGPFQGRPKPGLGFGFGPGERRGPHDRRRHTRCEAREEFRDHIRAHRGGPFGPGGPGFGPGFGRDFGGPGFGFGPGPRGGRRGAGPRGGRGKRGDVRAAILKLLADRPMHGYEMIQEIAERSNDLWKPSPGSIYPTLQLLEDEGLIVAAQSEGSKKLFELTDDGKAAAEKIGTAPWTEITEGADPAQVDLRNAVAQLFGAIRQSAFTASADQQQRILDIVNNARREIYQILGES